MKNNLLKLPIQLLVSLFLITVLNSEVLKRGIVNELAGKSFQMNIRITDLERVCTDKDEDVWTSPINPEFAGEYSTLFARGRELLKRMGIANRDNSQPTLSALSLSQRNFGKYRIWIASISYLQVISKAGEPLATRAISIGVPLDTIPIEIESTP